MPVIDESQLKLQIKNNEFSNAYLIYGDENYVKQFYVNKIKSKAVDSAFEAFNYRFFDGKDTDLDDALKDAMMFPMMSEYNFVLVKDCPVTKVKSDIKALEEFLSDIPESTIFIMYYDRLEPDEKSATFKKMVTLFKNSGSVVKIGKRTENDIAKLLISTAKKKKSTITSDNAKYLISVSGNDIQLLINELDKLSNYVNGGEITKTIIDSMATKCLQARVYDLSKAVVSGNSDTAYNVINTLFSMKEDPILLLAVIGGVYVDMYRVKCAKTSGLSYDDVAKNYNYRGREFALRNASRDCAKLTENQLRLSLDYITQADTKLKSTSVDSRLVIEELIAKLLLVAGGKYA